MSIAELQQDFARALESKDVEKMTLLVEQFDQFCRNEVESQTDLDKKKELIEQLLQIESDWQTEILQLKAKVRGKMADIKSNGKKINKYLNSF